MLKVTVSCVWFAVLSQYASLSYVGMAFHVITAKLVPGTREA